MNEKELDEMLELSDEYEVDKEVSKKIKRGINKNVNMKVVKILLCLILIFAAFWYGIPMGVKQTHYNPKNETGLVTKNEGFEDEFDDFEFLMQIYVGLNFPGLTYLSSKAEDHGNGDYTIYGRLHESYNKLNVDGSFNSTWTIHQSTMNVKTDDSHILSRIVGEFKGTSNDDAYYHLSEETVQNIKELPESAFLNVSISFNQTKNATEVIKFINQYDSSFFSWIALKSEEEKEIADGMTLWQSEFYELTKETKEKYPHLYLPNQNELTEDILLENYLSTLQLLIDHKDFIKVMNMDYLNCTIPSLQKRYDEAKKSGIQSIGVRGWVKKADLLKMIEKDGITNIGIADVKLSRLEK